MKNWTFAVLLGFCSLLTFNTSFAQETADVDAEFRAYCERTLRLLERARGQASTASQNGDFIGAVNLMITALKDNSTQRYGDLNPITLRLITHAYDLGVMLKDEVAKDVKGVKATAIALESFYDLIFMTAEKIDYRFYRCQARRFGCRYSRTLEFEQNMLEMVRDMLLVVNSSLVLNRGQIFPLGPSSAYLVAAEVISGAAYAEMTQLVYGSAYACEILDLKDISLDLEAFNTANMDEWSKKQKIQDVYQSFNQIIYSISSGRGCR